jgi:hypothetical protein
MMTASTRPMRKKPSCHREWFVTSRIRVSACLQTCLCGEGSVLLFFARISGARGNAAPSYGATEWISGFSEWGYVFSSHACSANELFHVVTRSPDFNNSFFNLRGFPQRWSGLSGRAGAIYEWHAACPCCYLLLRWCGTLKQRSGEW